MTKFTGNIYPTTNPFCLVEWANEPPVLKQTREFVMELADRGIDTTIQSVGVPSFIGLNIIASLNPDTSIRFANINGILRPSGMDFGPFGIRRIPNVDINTGKSKPGYTIIHNGKNRNLLGSEVDKIISNEEGLIAMGQNDIANSEYLDIKYLLEIYTLKRDLQSLVINSESTFPSIGTDLQQWQISHFTDTTFFQYDELVDTYGDTDDYSALTIFSELMAGTLPYDTFSLYNIFLGEWDNKYQRDYLLNKIAEKGLNATPMNWSLGYE
jgi:hypothetical protein